MPYVLKTVKPRVFSSKRINAFLTNKQISVRKGAIRKGATHSFSLTKFYKDNEVPNAIVNEYCKKDKYLNGKLIRYHVHLIFQRNIITLQFQRKQAEGVLLTNQAIL